MYSFLWFYLHRLVKLPVPMERLSMPPVSQRCPSFVYRVYATYIQSPFTFMLLFEGSWNLSQPFLSYLDLACQPFLVQLLIRAPYDRVLSHYTDLLSTSCWMMGDALTPSLLVDFIPSNSDHLFWDWNLESFLSALRLVVISGRFSHHWQFLGIHQCPPIDGSYQVFDLNTYVHTCSFAL